MALNPTLSNAAANAAVDAVTVLLNNGWLRIYDGAKPSTADTALGSQVLLAELRFNTTAFGAASAGVATANALTNDASANANGVATWFRAFKADGSTVILDGTVGTSLTDIILNNASIAVAAVVSITSFQYTQPKF